MAPKTRAARPAPTGPVPARRSYDSPVRRARTAATHDRIVTAGAQLLHGFPIWNWRALSVRAAAALAGVTERTVYRHFPTERDLREAVMARMAEEAGVELDDLDVGGVSDVASRILEYVSRFPLERRAPVDPTVAAANARQRAALLRAVSTAAGAVAPGTVAPEPVVTAALLDVLWSPVSYERLVLDWGLDARAAIAGITWLIGLIQRELDGGPPRPD